MDPNRDMDSHFEGIASVYRQVRTTDLEPIRLIRERLRGLDRVEGADIGCGDGRYDLLLFEHLPGLQLTCVDASRAMLDAATAHLEENGIADFDIVQSNVSKLELPEGAFDCVFTFNAIHHFDVPTFLARTSAALKAGGHVFIYTRLPEQNRRTIWGRLFPDFARKETRLYEFADMRRWIEESESLELEAVTPFSYPRQASLERLLSQARNNHYSTLAFYEPAEFEDALERFEDNLRREFDDPERIAWHDENVLLHLRKAAG